MALNKISIISEKERKRPMLPSGRRLELGVSVYILLTEWEFKAKFLTYKCALKASVREKLVVAWNRQLRFGRFLRRTWVRVVSALTDVYYDGKSSFLKVMYFRNVFVPVRSFHTIKIRNFHGSFKQCKLRPHFFKVLLNTFKVLLRSRLRDKGRWIQSNQCNWRLKPWKAEVLWLTLLIYSSHYIYLNSYPIR